MNELSRFWFLGVYCLLLLASGCETQPAPTAAGETTLPTAVPSTATSTPTHVPPTATAVPTLTPTPTPTVPPIVPLHFDHLQTVLPEDEIEARLAPWLFEPDVANALPLEALAATTAGTMSLTPEQAKEDVAFLFALLKNGYAGYGYFNENGRFDAAQARLISAIDEQTNINRFELREQILAQLDFVQDCHFSIEGSILCQQQYFWHAANLNFYNADGRYFTWQEGEQWWLTAVDGASPEEMLKLTFDEQGNPAYLLGLLANSQPEDSLLTFELPDGDILEERVGWETAVFEPPRTTYETYRTGNDIPVVVSRSFPSEDEKLPQFVADASDLANEPIVIVDIRGNGGGNSSWGEQWLQNLTGVTPEGPYIMLALWTETAVQGSINLNTFWGFGGDYLEPLRDELARLQQEGGGWVGPYIPEFSPLPNAEQLVIVLIDKGVASSGESFIGYLNQLENVVFVGENTYGAGQFGEVTRFILPNSGLPVQFGIKLFFHPDLSNAEGIGYLPDVWVQADQALDKTLAAIEAGWLQPGP